MTNTFYELKNIAEVIKITLDEAEDRIRELEDKVTNNSRNTEAPNQEDPKRPLQDTS